MSAEQWSAARAIAAAFLSGPWELDGMIERAGKRGRWLRGLARRTLAAFSQPNRPSIGTLGRFIAADPGFMRQASISARVTSAIPSKLQPVVGTPAMWELPQLTTTEALAEWLGISRGELDWFADRYGSARRRSPGPLSHYHYRWLPKRSGDFRLLEVPKARLKRFQGELLHGLLDRIQPHEAAHGFRSGRSIVSCASPHVGQKVVLRIDLKDFFASISAARVRGLFMTAGYPETVARLLSRLCTNDVPEFVWQDPALLNTAPRPRIARHGSLFRRRHLPQGAPTSPALANLCAYRLDCRLQGLARSAGAVYTRYADDLVFSGGSDFARSTKRFHIAVCEIALDEGFEVRTRKTRIMRRGVRQNAVGLVLNEKPNIRRADFDRLKATLHNCAVHGPESQNLA
jgi:RNA-directed DNA polymerase